MKCIFESNLYNNPIHNKHILRDVAEEPEMEEFRELESDNDMADASEGLTNEGPTDEELDAIENGDESAGEVGIPDAEDPTMSLKRGEESTVRDYIESECPEAIAAFDEDELNRLVGDSNIEDINNRIAEFKMLHTESCSVMASNLFGRQGYGSAILREDYQLQSMLSVEGNPQYEEPEVKKEPKPKEPRLTAKRNRRLRSKSRNIQIWDKKRKRFDPRYINTRFMRMCDAKEAIKKIGESYTSDMCDAFGCGNSVDSSVIHELIDEFQEVATVESIMPPQDNKFKILWDDEQKTRQVMKRFQQIQKQLKGKFKVTEELPNGWVIVIGEPLNRYFRELEERLTMPF